MREWLPVLAMAGVMFTQPSDAIRSFNVFQASAQDTGLGCHEFHLELIRGRRSFVDSLQLIL
jgi:hypothetical protein